MSSLLAHLGGLLLGWGVGSNDSANMFGTAVGARMVRLRTAVAIIAVCVILGAALQGRAGIDTVRQLVPADQRLILAICTLAAAVTMIAMCLLGMPVSSSQLMIGAVIGLGATRGSVDWYLFGKVLVCWLLNPLGALLVAAGFYVSLHRLLRWWRPSVFVLDPLLRLGLIIGGAYGAYALGANGVGVVCAAFVGDAPGLLSPGWGAFVGGVSIAVGALTYSEPVMLTVGRGVVPLDAFAAFIVVLSLAVTVHLFAVLGVPVSTTQTVVGALLGIGVVKGLHIVNLRTLTRVVIWWVASPVIAAAVAVAVYFALAR